MKTKNLLKSRLGLVIAILAMLVISQGAMAAWLGNSGVAINDTWYKSSSNVDTGHWLNGKTKLSGANLGTFSSSFTIGAQFDTYDNGNTDYCSWNSNTGVYYKITTTSGTQIVGETRLYTCHAEKSGNNNVWKTNGGNSCSDSGSYGTKTIDVSSYEEGDYYLYVYYFSPSSVKYPSSGFTTTERATFKVKKPTKYTYTVYFKKPSNWSNTPHIHTWCDDGDIKSDTEMESLPNQTGWYYYDVEYSTLQTQFKIMFNNGGWSGGQSGEATASFGSDKYCYSGTTPSTETCPSLCTTPTKSQYTMESQTVSYNGNAQKPSITVATGAGAVSKIYGSTDGGSNWTDYETSGPVNVGEYKIKINCNAGTTYCAANDIVLDNTFTIQNAQTSYALGGFLNGSNVNNFDEKWKLTETSQGSGVYEGSFSFTALHDKCEWLWIIEDNGTKWGRNSDTDILPSGNTILTRNQSSGKMRAIATVGVKFKVTFVPSTGSLTWAYDYDDLFKDSRTLYIRGPIVDETWKPATESSSYHVLEKVDNTYVVKFYGKASTETDKNKFVITTGFGEEYRLATSGFNLTHCTGDGHSSDDAKYNFIYEKDYDPTKGDVLKISITLVDGKPTLAVDQKTLPVINTVTGGSRCGTGTVGLKATATAGEGTVSIKWYAAAKGGDAIGEPTESDATWTTPSISTTTTYYAEAVDDNFASKTRTEVTATVIPLPEAGTINAGASVCKGSTVTLNVTNPSNASVQWQNSSKQDISDATSTSYTTPALQESTDYYVKFTDSNNCSSTSEKGTATVKDASLSIKASTATVNPYTRVTLTAKNQSGTETNSNWTITGAGSYFTESDNPTGVSSVVMKPAKDVETTVTATATVEGCEATGTYTVTPTPDTEVCN